MDLLADSHDELSGLTRPLPYTQPGVAQQFPCKGSPQWRLPTNNPDTPFVKRELSDMFANSPIFAIVVKTGVWHHSHLVHGCRLEKKRNLPPTKVLWVDMKLGAHTCITAGHTKKSQGLVSAIEQVMRNSVLKHSYYFFLLSCSLLPKSDPIKRGYPRWWVTLNCEHLLLVMLTTFIHI